MSVWSQLGHKLWSDKKWGAVGVKWRNRLRSPSSAWWLAAGCQQGCLCSAAIDLFSSPDGCDCFWRGRYEPYLTRIIIKSVFVCYYFSKLCFTDVHRYILISIDLCPSFDPANHPQCVENKKTCLQTSQWTVCVGQIHPHGSHCNKPRHNKTKYSHKYILWIGRAKKQPPFLFTCKNARKLHNAILSQ